MLNYLKFKYPKQVKFGWITCDQARKKNTYCVWGVNSVNWNLGNGEKIPGGGQAIYMKYQIDGVFGIVTTPLTGLPS